MFLVNARMRLLFGDRSIREESSFIKEIEEEHIEFQNKKREEISTINKEDKFYTEDVDFNQGDIIVHDDFGEGVIINVEKV